MIVVMIVASIIVCFAMAYFAYKIYQSSGWQRFSNFCATFVFVTPLIGTFLFLDNVNAPVSWCYWGPMLLLDMIYIGILSYTKSVMEVHKDEYDQYLDKKINALPIPDDNKLLDYKEKAGYNRNIAGFEVMNDIEKSAAIFEWRKEMRQKLYNPIECAKLFGKEDDEEVEEEPEDWG